MLCPIHQPILKQKYQSFIKSSMNKIQADRQFREQHSKDEKVLKPLPVDKKTLLQQGSDLQSSLELLQAASNTFPEAAVPKDFVGLLAAAKSHVTLVDGYCAYMDGIDSEMQSVHQDAVKFLDEDKCERSHAFLCGKL